MEVAENKAPPTIQTEGFPMQYLLALYADESVFEKKTPEQQQKGYAVYMAYTQALKAAARM